MWPWQIKENQIRLSHEGCDRSNIGCIVFKRYGGFSEWSEIIEGALINYL